MQTIRAIDIRNASENERLPMLLTRFSQLGGVTPGETAHLFGSGKSANGRTPDGYPKIQITPDVVARQLDELVELERLGADSRFTVERLLVAYQGIGYNGVSLLN